MPGRRPAWSSRSAESTAGLTWRPELSGNRAFRQSVRQFIKSRKSRVGRLGSQTWSAVRFLSSFNSCDPPSVTCVRPMFSEVRLLSFFKSCSPASATCVFRRSSAVKVLSSIKYCRPAPARPDARIEGDYRGEQQRWQHSPAGLGILRASVSSTDAPNGRTQARRLRIVFVCQGIGTESVVFV
jgi:hypothetical protein